MPKITALPPMVSAAADDEAPIVDKSASTTKKWTLTLLKTYLQTLTAWITNAMVADGFAVQVVTQQTSAVATGTTLIPLDDTIPQSTEGTEFITASITPKSTTNRLVVDVVLVCAYSVTAHKIAALFQDANVNAVAASDEFQQTAGGINTIKLRYDMVAGTVSAITFRARAGGNTAGTMTVNGESANRRFGAITKTSITITEYKAS